MAGSAPGRLGFHGHPPPPLPFDAERLNAVTPTTAEGKLAPERSGGFLPPKLKPGNPVNDGVIEVLTTVASFWYPGTENIDELSREERRRWLRFREAVTKGQYSIADLMKTLKEIAKAQHAVDLEEQKEMGEERRELFTQRLYELKSSYAGKAKERKQVMGLITLCVVALVICACLTAFFAQPWVVAGVGACTAIVAAIGVLIHLRSQITEDDPPGGFA